MGKVTAENSRKSDFNAGWECAWMLRRITVNSGLLVSEVGGIPGRFEKQNKNAFFGTTMSLEFIRAVTVTLTLVESISRM